MLFLLIDIKFQLIALKYLSSTLRCARLWTTNEDLSAVINPRGIRDIGFLIKIYILAHVIFSRCGD